MRGGVTCLEDASRFTMEEDNTCWLSQLRDYFEVQSEDATNLKVVCKLINIRFAVDTDIIEQTNEILQDTVDKLHSESERYGMHINVAKTKTMVFGKKSEVNDAKVNIDRQAIENVKSFIYLGSEFTWDNDCSKDIQRRISLATAVYSWLQSIMERQWDND